METFHLTAQERARVAEVAEEVQADWASWDPLRFAEEAAAAAHGLPLRLRRFLSGVRASEADLAVVSGLPVDPALAPTPAGWDLAAKTGAGRREELVLLLVGSVLGEPFGWVNQQDGRLVHDVVPAPGMEESLTSASSAAQLTLHTEDVFHPFRCDYVSLFCLRNPDEVGTTFTRIDALDFPEDLREVLSESRFRFYPDDSHTGEILNAIDGEQVLGNRRSTVGPVVFGPAEHPYLRFDRDFMTADRDDEKTATAIQVTHDLLCGAAERIVLQPGDAVFIDNYRIVHGREPFHARYDGNDRWLKRLNLIRDVRRIYAGNGARRRIIT
ncbi:TauD/TfdA family dioxygenase [[Actinomadura] parvosata]|uniref:TauD/TfdA family dioxygenase n=1 Tax=[Actinomadura] parvosata TaxID=1955412 RepID=UPI001C8FE4D7|nr:TauD/TfdA family dioxygenase [Nonomuraea sp. ATCC 55076]